MVAILNGSCALGWEQLDFHERASGRPSILLLIADRQWLHHVVPSGNWARGTQLFVLEKVP